MARKQRFREEEEAAVDMTPMLDIVFIMLIFFIVTTSFVKEAGIEVNKPKAAQATKQKNANIFIAIRSNGEIWVDKQQIDVERISAKIESLQADKEAKHGVVVKVMDQIKATGDNLRISIAGDQ